MMGWVFFISMTFDLIGKYRIPGIEAGTLYCIIYVVCRLYARYELFILHSVYYIMKKYLIAQAQ